MNEGGIIVDSRDLEVNVLTGIPTFSEEYKNQIRDFIKENNVGETINDFLDYAKKKNIQVYSVPYMDLLKQIGEALKIEKVSTLTKMINVLTIGISFALLKYDKKLVEDAIKATFHEKIADMNVTAVDQAYDYAEKNLNVNSFKYKLEKQDVNEPTDFPNWKSSRCNGQSFGRLQNTNILPHNPSGRRKRIFRIT